MPWPTPYPLAAPEPVADPEPAQPVPTVGRIVHFHVGGACHAAIVTAAAGTTATLTVFRPDGRTIAWPLGIEPGDTPGTWHWPERA